MIRRAQPDDAAAIHRIYAHYARETAITFAASAPSAEDFTARMANERYPFLVAEEDGQVAGFIYASPYHTKEAYRFNVELTIYLAPDRTGRGLGAALMAPCLDELLRLGYRNVYSCITLPNPASIRLHQHFGFVQVGLFPHAGWKLNQWHDVVWLAWPGTLSLDPAGGQCPPDPQVPGTLSLDPA